MKTIHSISGCMAVSAMIVAAGALGSCSSSRSGAGSSDVLPSPEAFEKAGFGAYRSAPGPAVLPNAHIYRTSIDVDALVPVTVNPATGQLISYPAPTDITGASMPVVLKDGWLLDRRGVGADTRFINYTYSQYHDLAEAPSVERLLQSIVPDARVTEIVELPYKIGEVTPAMADSLISAGLPRCEVILQNK
ncbi:MAG: hypothetical protein K2G05_08335 [Duncaniella sp.]|nr:hypothetical protein [Bacteroides sp.]MDE6038255.1 hypothetical protein [Duncaniella sp.]MDE6066170.1 hypothetical protein [Duncaniella sp.]